MKYTNDQYEWTNYCYPDGRTCPIYIVPGRMPQASAFGESSTVGGLSMGGLVLNKVIVYLQTTERATYSEITAALGEDKKSVKNVLGHNRHIFNVDTTDRRNPQWFLRKKESV